MRLIVNKLLFFAVVAFVVLALVMLAGIVFTGQHLCIANTGLCFTSA